MIWLEVLDRRGNVRERVRLDAFPVTIGRGYGNAVVLDDPYVDPQHARMALNEAGQLVIEDLGSLNGLRDGKGSEHRPSLVLLPGGTFQLGESTLRLATEQLTVAPARRLPTSRGEVPASRPFWTTMSPAVAALIFAFGQYLGEGTRVTVGEIFANVTGMLVILAVWAGGWALATRIVSHRFSFGAHVIVVAGVVIAALVLGECNAWAQTMWPDSLGLSVFEWAYGFALMCTLLYLHLQVVAPKEPARRWRQALIFNAALAAVGFLVTLGDDDKFSVNLSYPAALRPVPSGWVSATSPEEFGNSLVKLQEEVDELKR